MPVYQVLISSEDVMATIPASASPPVGSPVLELPPEPSLSVTQVVSLVFYLIPFILVAQTYDPEQSGFGTLSAEAFKNIDPVLKQVFRWFLLGLVVFSNAIRYYLSVWFIEENPQFQKLRTSMTDLLNAVEWTLRASCVIFLYLLQFTLPKSGRLVEVVLILIFGLLVFWDLLLLWQLKGERGIDFEQVVKDIFRSWRLESVKKHGNGKYDELYRDVLTWVRIEGVGLIACLGYYVAAAKLAPKSMQAFMFATGILLLVFFGIFVVDLIVQWKHYVKWKNLIAIALCLGIGMGAMWAFSLLD